MHVAAFQKAATNAFSCFSQNDSKETFLGVICLSFIFPCNTAISVCGLAYTGIGAFGFPNGWPLPCQETLSEMIKEVEEETK